jgi:hypothetical protein
MEHNIELIEEERESILSFAGYFLDNEALCIGDSTDDGTPIPDWAFSDFELTPA